MNDVVVSICCITYNHHKYIRRAIDGFLMQKTSFKYEILIHDDASTDGTSEIIRRYEARYPELIKAVIQKENKYKKGMDEGYFYGFEPFCQDLFPMAKGRFLALCEGDDYWTDPDKIQKQVEYMDKHPEHSMCYHSTNMLMEETKQMMLFNPARTNGKDFSREEMVATPAGIATASKMLRNYYNEKTKKDYLTFTGDCFMTAFYATFGSCGFVKDIKPSVYRIHSEGVWSGKSMHQKRALVYFMNTKLYELFSKMNHPKFTVIRKRILDQQRAFGIIIPTFQRGDGKTPFYLSRCIASIYAQTHQDFIIYLIGDDYIEQKEVEKIIERYNGDGRLVWENLPEAVERLKYFDNKEVLWSCGGVNATNRGLELAKKDGIKYVCLLDHDDYWKPDHLETLSRAFQETKAVWLCTKTSVDPKASFFLPRGMTGKTLEKFLPAPGDCIKASVCFDAQALPFQMRDVFEETGAVYPSDADLWARMADHIKKNNLRSYYLGKHTCIHDDEGYVRKGGMIKCCNVMKNLTESKVDKLVTGIVVCYNTKDLMERAYNSVRKFHPNMNIIIVDGSDKNNSCYEYICTLANENTRVFHTKRNIGHGIGLTIGISYARTPFVLLFDSDIEMLKSPVLKMLEKMEDDTYGIGYIEKTAFDGHEWGSKPVHKNQGWMRYLHPYFCLIQLKEYKKYAPFIHHGAPAVNTMLDIHKRGLSEKVIKEFPGLGHSSGKGWVWEGKPREFIRHDTAGTRSYRRSRGLEEIEGVWDQVMAV